MNLENLQLKGVISIITPKIMYLNLRVNIFSKKRNSWNNIFSIKVV